ncbi:MAG: PH domain-containing protein [Candidatus Thorarchaeota archaeon]|nr:MAG: PH domain-containing protein [Candidatus Thorarchaeota archaeon]
MSSGYDERVIKPPLESVAFGRVFKPTASLRNKYWFIAIITALIMYLTTIGTFFGIMYMVYSINQTLFQWQTWFDSFWGPVNFWFWGIALVILIPYIVGVPIYLNRFEYSVRGESGETMPEVYVKKGIINVTVKHVPLRTITNISTRTGPFDRLFKIGNVEIHTAGQSGSYYEAGKPEEKIEGIVFYEELRDYILGEMRKLKGTYAVGTEVLTPDETPIPGNIDEAILTTLRQLRDILRRMDEKLDRGGY